MEVYSLFEIFEICQLSFIFSVSKIAMVCNYGVHHEELYFAQLCSQMDFITKL